MVFFKFHLSIPRPVVAAPCGSKSINRVCFPRSARYVERLIDVVVLPLPPFWFATAITSMLELTTYKLKVFTLITYIENYLSRQLPTLYPAKVVKSYLIQSIFLLHGFPSLLFFITVLLYTAASIISSLSATSFPER